METEIKRNKKTLLDQHGQYPVWMNQRQRKRLKAKREKKRGKSKAKAAKGLAWQTLKDWEGRQTCWCTPLTPALRGRGSWISEFGASLVYGILTVLWTVKIIIIQKNPVSEKPRSKKGRKEKTILFHNLGPLPAFNFRKNILVQQNSSVDNLPLGGEQAFQAIPVCIGFEPSLLMQDQHEKVKEPSVRCVARGPEISQVQWGLNKSCRKSLRMNKIHSLEELLAQASELIN